MTSYKLTLRIDEINAASGQAFRETAFLLGREFTRVITEPRSWEGFDGPRDIVDLGQLRSAQQLVFTGPMEATYSWNTEYAAAVALGYQPRNGKYVKGRNWVEIAQQEFDIQQTFSELYQANLNSI